LIPLGKSRQNMASKAKEIWRFASFFSVIVSGESLM
jgi:hypothetical protein